MHALLPITFPISGEIRKTFDIFIIIPVRCSLLLSRSLGNGLSNKSHCGAPLSVFDGEAKARLPRFEEK